MELGLALLDQNSIMQVDNNVKAVHNLVARLLLKVVKKQANPPHQQDLSGLLPLVRFSHSLMDTIILVLRKALFSMSVHTGQGVTTGGDAAPQDIHDLYHQVSQSSGSLS